MLTINQEIHGVTYSLTELLQYLSFTVIPEDLLVTVGIKQGKEFLVRILGGRGVSGERFLRSRDLGV